MGLDQPLSLLGRFGVYLLPGSPLNSVDTFVKSKLLDSGLNESRVFCLLVLELSWHLKSHKYQYSGQYLVDGIDKKAIPLAKYCLTKKRLLYRVLHEKENHAFPCITRKEKKLS